MVDSKQKSRLIGIFNLPGEGLMVELGFGDSTALYDKQGLQFRLIQLQQTGLDVSTEQSALSQINNFAPAFDVW